MRRFFLPLLAGLAMLIACSQQQTAGTSSSTDNSVTATLVDSAGKPIAGRLVLRSVSALPESLGGTPRQVVQSPDTTTLSIPDGEWILEASGQMRQGDSTVPLVAWSRLRLNGNDMRQEMVLARPSSLTVVLGTFADSGRVWWIGVPGTNSYARVSGPLAQSAQAQLRAMGVGTWGLELVVTDSKGKFLSRSVLAPDTIGVKAGTSNKIFFKGP